jgi:hypothetical protein
MIKKHVNKILFFFVNFLAMLVGIFIIKNHEQGKQAAASSVNAEMERTQQAMSAKAQELELVISQIRQLKLGSIADNPSQATIQQPTTVTQTIPGKTTTIKVPSSSSGSSSSSSSSSSSKTTKTS